MLDCTLDCTMDRLLDRCLDRLWDRSHMAHRSVLTHFGRTVTASGPAVQSEVQFAAGEQNGYKTL